MPVSARGAGFSVRGWWLFILLAILTFRACATQSNRWQSSPVYEPPRIRPAPGLDEAPPVVEEAEEGALPHDLPESSHFRED